MKQLIAGRNHYFSATAHILFDVSFKSLVDPLLLAKSVEETIKEYEIFNMKLSLHENGLVFYEKLNKPRIHIEFLEDFISIKDLSNRELKKPFDISQGDLIRFNIYRLDNKTHLFISAHHLVGDGLSLTYFVKSIVNHLNQNNETNPFTALQLMEDFGYPNESKLVFSKKLARTWLNSKWSKYGKIFTQKEFEEMFQNYWKNKTVTVLSETIENDEYLQLVQQAKSNHISVNSLISAVFLKEFQIQDLGYAVSVRPLEYYGLGNYASGITINYAWKMHQSFWHNAKQIHQTIHNKLKDTKRKYFVLQFLDQLSPTLIDSTNFVAFSNYKNKTAELATKLFRYTEDTKHPIGITNLGKINLSNDEDQYQIDSIIFIPPILPLNTMVLGIASVNNKMTLTIQFDETETEKYNTKFYQSIEKLKKLQ